MPGFLAGLLKPSFICIFRLEIRLCCCNQIYKGCHLLFGKHFTYLFTKKKDIPYLLGFFAGFCDLKQVEKLYKMVKTFYIMLCYIYYIFLVLTNISILLFSIICFEIILYMEQYNGSKFTH